MRAVRTSAALFVGANTRTRKSRSLRISGRIRSLARYVVLPVPGGPKMNSIFSVRSSLRFLESSNLRSQKPFFNSSRRNAGRVAVIRASDNCVRSTPSIFASAFNLTRRLKDWTLITSMTGRIVFPLTQRSSGMPERSSIHCGMFLDGRFNT